MQKDRTKKMGQLASAAVLIFMVFLCFHIKDQGMNQTLFEQALSEGKRVLFHQTARQYAMQIGYIMEQDGTEKTVCAFIAVLSSSSKFIQGKLGNFKSDSRIISKAVSRCSTSADKAISVIRAVFPAPIAP